MDPRAPRSPVVTLLLTPGRRAEAGTGEEPGEDQPVAAQSAGHDARRETTGPITTEVLDPKSTRDGARRPRRRRIGGKAPTGRSEDWQELTGAAEAKEAAKKEPEKPRVVVDVYRGDKHVQELFK